MHECLCRFMTTSIQKKPIYRRLQTLGTSTSSSCVPMAVLRLSTWRTSPMINCASPLTITAYGQLKSFLMMLMGRSSILISHLMAMISHTSFTLTTTTHSTILQSQMVDGRLQPAHHLSLKYLERLPRKQRLCLTAHLFPHMQ